MAATFFVERGLGHDLRTGADRYMLIGVVALLPWLGVFANQRLYNTRFIGRRIDEFRRIINACFFGAVIVTLTGYLAGVLLPRSVLVSLFVLSTVTVLIERELARRLFARLRTTGRMLRYVVIAGANPEGCELAAMLRTETWLGYHVIGFVDDTCTDPQPVAGVPLLGSIGDTGRILRDHSGSSVIVASSGVESHTTNRLARDLLDQGIHVELSSTLRDISSQRLTGARWAGSRWSMSSPWCAGDGGRRPSARSTSWERASGCSWPRRSSRRRPSRSGSIRGARCCSSRPGSGATASRSPS
jgi:FlaA1/EpsC-like NDP-sugar epimerase